MDTRNNILRNLFLIGVSHWNTPVDVREQFCLSKEEMLSLYQSAKTVGINSVFAISTCNRTEIYALAENADKLIQLLLKNKPVTQELTKHIYVKKADDAVQHLFNVSAGLDAQILGDAQITGQIREFHQWALENNTLDASLNRLIEQAISAGKKIKTQTQFNVGASSIAHAAVVAVVKNNEQRNFRALVVGSGKTGVMTVKSLLKFIPSSNITLLNRTDAKAVEKAKEFAVNTDGFNSLKKQITNADVIFTATSSPDLLITNNLLQGIRLEGKLFIDLSMPRNIAPDINATLIDISKLSDAGAQRKAEYSVLAEKLIQEGMIEYYEWLHRYELAQTVKSSIAEFIFDNGLEETEATAPSKFIDGITSRHLRHFQKAKQSRNLAA